MVKLISEMSDSQLEFIGVKVPEQMARAAREAAWENRITLSELVRRAIIFALANAETAFTDVEAA
ncbi:MAG: hypothetical protein E6Q97_27525 [Desulfurellales bacterium]|nr:MAG: hypothetical protein E6Q97_27525 [Desulfurellales bacterium]